MIDAVAGVPFTARVAAFPADLEGVVGVQVLDSLGGAAVPRRTSVTEDPAGSGSYIATLTLAVPGSYSIFWDWDGGDTPIPSHTATENLVVSGSATPGTTATPLTGALTSTPTPHFALPFRFLGTAFAVNEQDTDDDITDCVEAILRTPVGSRVEAPDFGVPDQTFALTVDASIVAAAVAAQDPRVEAIADAESITVPDYVSAINVQIEATT